MTTEQLYELYFQHPAVETDTRKLQKGDIFFALSGPHFNGNAFAQTALEAGAAYAIVDEDIPNLDGRIIRVDNVLESLQMLAKFHREQFAIPFIGITGSNGKTTTKELVSAVLSTKYKTYTTVGNLNNHIGVPLTLLRIKADAEIAVVEMGANHLHEIESYCHYAEPTHGVITNCGKAHLEGFGSLEGVKKGKGELFDFLRANHGTAFICSDYDYLQELSSGIEEIVTYGTAAGDVTGKALPSTDFLQVLVNAGDEQITINTRMVGSYNLPNVLCAVAIGYYFQVPLSQIVLAIEQYEPGNSRSQMLVKGTNHIILDAYNANPTSMQAAIENFAKVDSDNKLLLLGAMKEMGEDADKEHQLLVDLIDEYNWKEVILVGEEFRKTLHNYSWFSGSAEVADWLSKQQLQNAYILIKGSRSMQMEKIADSI